MYEKIVNYFESNLCIENIYFREKYKVWIGWIMVVVLLEIIINNVINNIVDIVCLRIIIMSVVSFSMTAIILVFIYVKPIVEIYKKKIKSPTKIDWIALLMREEILSAYREVEIEEMEKYLVNICEIQNTESLDIIIDMINEEIKDKYTKENFIEKYFGNIILPILIFVLTIYFTNINEKNLGKILVITIISIISSLFAGYCITAIRKINVTPNSKKENLLELKRVLMDLKIKWSRE